MMDQQPAPTTALTRGLVLGSLLFFVPLLLLVMPQVGQAASWQVTNLQGRAVFQLAAAPAEGLILYYAATSTDGLQRSSISTSSRAPGFELWHEADNGLPGRSFWEVPAVQRLAVNPNNGRELIVLLGTGEQSSLHHSNDGGATWQLVRGNLESEQASAIALMADGSMAVANGNRILWRTAPDAGWIETPAWPATAGQAHTILAINVPRTTAARPVPGLLVVTTGGSLFTLDSVSDTSWHPRPVGSANRVDLAVAATQGIYAATDRGVYHSTDTGATWSQVGDLPGGAGARAMAVDPADNAAVYVAMAGEGVFASYDGGATWEVIGRGLERQHVYALVVDPRAQRQLLVATNDGVWRHALRAGE